MRIGQLAELAGTTTRAVRHYHRIGLLAEPARLSNGFRSYDMSDAIRLTRIRWLADGGVPLESIATLLADGEPGATTSPVVDDLRSLVGSIDAQLSVLSRRRDRLTQLLQDAEADRPLSPLPRVLAELFDIAVAAAESAAVRAALLRERELVETMVMSGRAPEGFVDGFTAVLEDEDRRSRYLDLLARWNALEHREPAEVAEEITAVSTEIAALMSPIRVQDAEGPLPLLDDVVPDRAQQDVVSRVRRRLREAGPTSERTP